MAKKILFCCLMLVVTLTISQCNDSEETAVCGFPEIPMKAEIVNRTLLLKEGTIFKENDTVTYECKNDSRNFDVNTTSKICQKNGTWLGSPIQCHVLVAEQDVASSGNSKLEKKEKILNTSAYIEYNTTYKLTYIEICFQNSTQNAIDNNTICQVHPIELDNKTSCVGTNSCKKMKVYSFSENWNESIHITNTSVYRLSNRKCGESPEAPLHANFAIQNTKSNITVSYRCRNGYQLIGNPNRICIHDIGNWEPEPPQCVLESTSKQDANSSRFSPDQNSSVDQKAAIPIIIVSIILMVIILAGFCIWMKKKKRLGVSKPEDPSEAAHCKEMNVENQPNPSSHAIYENIQTVYINPSPIYAQLEFNQPITELYAVVDKNKKKEIQPESEYQNIQSIHENNKK